MTRCWFLLGVAALAVLSVRAAEEPARAPASPRLVGHRGLLKHAPENTLAGFAACIDLRLGFELDVRRSRDGKLVCVHDDDVLRTTGVQGKVAELTLAELRKLDGGRTFDPAFTGERIPTLDEVFRLLKERRTPGVLVAIDLKVSDDTLEAEVIQLAKKHEVLGQVVCIGLAIGDASVRRKLRAADAKSPVAVLAQTAEDLPAALDDKDADWVYVRFVPTAERVAKAHGVGKRVFLTGPLVMPNEPDNWRKAAAAGVDAVLTDFPLECRAAWKAKP